MEEKRVGPGGLYRNAVSFFGALIAAGSVLLIVFSIALEYSLKRPSPYLGIFTFMIFPTFFAIGALIFLWGMRRESLRRREAGTDEALPYPLVDLNLPRHRRKFVYVAVGGTFLAVLMAFVTYNAFLYSESVQFCGTLCHTVMKPEYQAYLASPHARVRCVDCHIGEGAEWFVKAKISGLRQVYAVTFQTYERPIPTPIANLRPARETCEECHWPAKFFGTQLMQNPHFRYDEKNSAEQISLGVKTGGGESTRGGAGIHWHMIIKNRVVYAAVDRKKQEIPYFEVRDEQGKVTETYTSLDYKGTPEQLAALPRSNMDCMDCHNRPTHVFVPPDTAVDRAMMSNLIPRTLPWAKKVVVDALVKEYPSSAKAHEGLAAEIGGFYKQKYPAVFGSRKADIDNAVAAAIDIFDRSVFPEMNVNWQTYTSNIGHRNWPGCFRCHDGRHVSNSGKTLSMDCAECHTLPVRSALMPLGTVSMEGKVPWHPVALEGKHATILCSKCHSAGYRPPIDCGECHKFDASAPMMGDACTTCHLKPGQKQPQVACAKCHTPVVGLHKKKEHTEAGCTECHKPHGWTIKGRDTCLSCHDDKKEHNAPDACAECHEFRKAGK
ncbi:MAG: NapC/NirT family cytochrome c [Thermodesulfobacteriota bacterium]